MIITESRALAHLAATTELAGGRGCGRAVAKLV
jgi:hypothetical protein